jgi:hypothetical protein
VVTTETFRRYQDESTNAINLATSRLRATEGEIKTLRERVATVVSQTQQEVEKSRAEHRREIRRLRRRVSSDSMMSMMLGMMASRRQQDAFDGHTHDIASSSPGETEGPNTGSDGGGSDNLMMILPFMMMGQGEGRDGGDDGGDNNMMGIVMAMAMMR